MAKPEKPTKSWIESMIKDEKEGIRQYSGKSGFSAQVRQEKAHLKKLQRKLKQL